MSLEIYNSKYKYGSGAIVVVPKSISPNKFWDKNVKCTGVINFVSLSAEDAKLIIKKLLEGDIVWLLGDNEHIVIRIL